VPTADLRQPFRDLQELYDRSPLHRWLGLKVVEQNGGVVVRGRLERVVTVDGPRQIVHGGVVTALLDIAATFALIEHTRRDWFTADLRVDFLRFATVGLVEVSGRVLHVGSSLGRARAELRGEEGDVCAIASGTWVPMR
jgi:uncharacterized protein (TIGR00369 family)